MPFCVQWKGTLPAGKTYENPVIQLDILPTALAAAGGEVEAGLEARRRQPAAVPDRQEQRAGRTRRCTGDSASSGPSATATGSWWRQNTGSREGCLYDLASDPGELHNLAAERPDIVGILKVKWDVWNAEQCAGLGAAQKIRLCGAAMIPTAVSDNAAHAQPREFAEDGRSATKRCE